MICILLTTSSDTEQGPCFAAKTGRGQRPRAWDPWVVRHTLPRRSSRPPRRPDCLPKGPWITSLEAAPEGMWRPASGCSVCLNQRLLSLYLVANSCPTLGTPWTVAHQAPLSMGFYRQQYWSGLPFPSTGDLPSPGIKPGSPVLQVDSLSTER